MNEADKISAQQSVIAAIESAFASRPYPGDDNIVSDNTDYPNSEASQIKALFKGHHWRTVPFTNPPQYSAGTAFLSPEGFRFFLPAYMILCIKHPDEADILLTEVISALTIQETSDFEKLRNAMEESRKKNPDDNALPDEIFKSVMDSQEDFYRSGASKSFRIERISGFTQDEGRAIRKFLEYMRDIHSKFFGESSNPQIAIDRYWYRF